ncbi:MAG: DUF3168 domain-containing protein [Candidatus Shapirobacteria bacterium]|jgi:acid stress-induced BolA-like protein IbaG/YrbA
MDIRSAIIAKLKQAPSVSDSIWLSDAPRDTAFPYVVIDDLGGQRTRFFAGKQHKNASYVIAVYHTSDTTAESTRDAIIARLDEAALTGADGYRYQVTCTDDKVQGTGKLQNNQLVYKAVAAFRVKATA